MRGLFTFKEAVALCQWPVANSYFAYDNKIWPSAEDGWKTWTAPLCDPNLFVSLAKLGGRGDDLPDSAALRWVGRRGLFGRLDEGSRLPYVEAGEMNQRPLPFAEFRAEARRAHRVGTLVEDIRSGRIEVLRGRIGRDRFVLPGGQGGGEWERLSLDGEPIPGTEGPAPKADYRPVAGLRDKPLLSVARIALEGAVLDRVRGVEPTFFPDFNQPRPQFGDYGSRYSCCVPDLRRAVWTQVAYLIDDLRRPPRYCEVCNEPFVPKRRDHVICDGACREAKRRRKKAS